MSEQKLVIPNHLVKLVNKAGFHYNVFVIFLCGSPVAFDIASNEGFVFLRWMLLSLFLAVAVNSFMRWNKMLKEHPEIKSFLPKVEPQPHSVVEIGSPRRMEPIDIPPITKGYMGTWGVNSGTFLYKL